ncbi:ribbon-helix-helix domain-containing protein [Hahella aquimaris]|uniref:ribbon-helix-helix domain-containing protein n=1 Tax=Hahella sp. HNIBRBA332 TaxID=3015983 RepID=UPI00273CF15F|nr:ribbon-helix-helix domain-containing protein [Hahella sp. HNIBRBA332]WLQ11397.1 ribbon-helix-helix domain-containing protein [Hahella sp. HNIBRBA332]
MCEIYANTDPQLYEAHSKSVRLRGFVTSVRLEQRFWTLLEEIAGSEGMSTSQFMAKLYDEVVEKRGEVGNFASLLRVVCATYLERKYSAGLIAV